MAKLIITTKNGRHRKDHEFVIDQETATDPAKRASAISAKKALFNNVVNYRIEE
jgi:hypothetical protein